MPGVEGCDISHWNRMPNLDPYEFVILKATEGTDFTDSTYHARVDQVRAAGKLTGSYHFLSVTLDIQQQLDHFANVATIQAGELVALDFEWDKTWQGRTNKFLAEQADWAMKLLMEDYPDNRVLLYCNRSTYGNTVEPYSVFLGDGLWLASPGAEPRVPWTIWQYGSGGVDFDRANFEDIKYLRMWADSKGHGVSANQQQLNME